MLSYTIRKILVPIDMSETSLNALDTAVLLAKRHNASLLMVNVIESGFDFLGDAIGFSSLTNLSHSADVLTALAGGIQNAHSINPKVIQEEGHVSHVILKTALLHQADLIVIGTHGASGYRDGFIGSNTYSILKHSTCPVLTIPPKRKFSTFRKVMFPVRPMSGALVRYDVVSKFMAPNSMLDVVGMSNRGMEKETKLLDKLLEEICDRLGQDKVLGNTAWGKGQTISEDVLDYAHQYQSDLIIITAVLDVTTKQYFIGPHTQKILNCSKVPVLSVKRVFVPTLA